MAYSRKFSRFIAILAFLIRLISGIPKNGWKFWIWRNHNLSYSEIFIMEIWHYICNTFSLAEYPAQVRFETLTRCAAHFIDQDVLLTSASCLGEIVNNPYGNGSNFVLYAPIGAYEIVLDSNSTITDEISYLVNWMFFEASIRVLFP